MQSIGGASPHVKVTLYKSSGVSVATSTVNLPWSTPLGGGGSETVTFSNLNSSTNYYAVIENMDTVETGTILCVVKQISKAEAALLICTPFTGHPVGGVLLCGTRMSTKGNV